MTTSIIPFDFETNAVRIVMREGEPWFVAADVCRVLEHSNSRKALRMLDDDEKGVTKGYTLGGDQDMNIVSESGLYTLIIRSNLPAAKRFRKWITSKVIPAIRRDGAYELPSEDRLQLDDQKAYLETLPEEHRARARKRAEVIGAMEDAIADGARVTEAAEAAAIELNVSLTSIWSMRRAVYMTPRSSWEAALAPRWKGPRGMTAECHPEAMAFFLTLIAKGQRRLTAYRRTVAVAAERGWSPIPSAQTMARVAQRAELGGAA